MSAYVQSEKMIFTLLHVLMHEFILSPVVPKDACLESIVFMTIKFRDI